VKACVLERPGDVRGRPLALREVARPEPGPGEILVRVEACGVCRTDLHVVEGELPARKRPVIPGHQVVGAVERMGAGARGFRPGDRAGVAWLHSTCGRCRHCASARENLCLEARFTGWSADGGFAEYIAAPAEYAYRVPAGLSAAEAAPLLCAGIVGYRCLRRCELAEWNGARLGLYGFGAAAHIAIQIARFRGAEVYVCTRDRERHQALAEELGAAWVGGTTDHPPVALDAAIIYAPAGEIVPAALRALDRGGRLVLGGIHMSPIPALDYADLYWEKSMSSVANNTRADGREFLDEAARAGVRTRVQPFPLEEANEALIALKHDAVRGAAVLTIGG
jgi:propanol-preferring alcohol dehydrogenase